MCALPAGELVQTVTVRMVFYTVLFQLISAYRHTAIQTVV